MDIGYLIPPDKTNSFLKTEAWYPNICESIRIVLDAEACDDYMDQDKLDWPQDNITSFKNLIMKYTKENMVLANIYMKEPFAHKLLVIEDETW